VFVGDEDIQELAQAHVASLVSRPGLRRVVQVAHDATAEAAAPRSAPQASAAKSHHHADQAGTG
jgi:hypothetical protein